MNTLRLATGILVIFVLGIIVLNAVQAQTTPTPTPAGTYEKLSINVPLIKDLVANNIPVLQAGQNIYPALQAIASLQEGYGFAVLTDEPYGLYYFASDGEDAEIQVYQYNKSTTSAANSSALFALDCSDVWWEDTETGDIRPFLTKSNGTITAESFMAEFCPDREIETTLGLTKQNAIQLMTNASRYITDAYAGKNPFVSASGGTTTQATVATPTPATVTACDVGTIVKYQLSSNQMTELGLVNGRFGLSASGTPNPVSGNPLAIASDDTRLPISLIFKNIDQSVYLLNITQFTYDGEEVTIHAQLCKNENKTWKEVWPATTYSIYDPTKAKFISYQRNGSPQTVFYSKINNRETLPELNVRFSGGGHESVTASVYLNEDAHTIQAVALNAQRESSGKDYRFDIDAATMELLTSTVAGYQQFSPDQLREELKQHIQFIGKKNLNGSNYSAEKILIQEAEGVLNNGGTFNNTYWKISSMNTPGEYELKINIPEYRSITRKILVQATDLSPTEGDRITASDIAIISILGEELKKDQCSACNTLQACLMCVDTALVDKLASTN